MLGGGKKPTGKQVATGGGVVAALVAGLVAYQQLGDVLVMKEPHDLIHMAEKAARNLTDIDIQLIQAEIQLDIIVSRQAKGVTFADDEIRKARLLEQIKRLEAAKEKIQRDE